MFSGDFLEGQKLSSNRPTEVALPEDDPDAMEILCNIIHLHNDIVPDRLEAKELLVMGQLVDKYGLRRVVHLAMDK